ncbi:GMC oxidoreductase-domain-containing protein [Lasiosphaeria ovina]|uniref:GMC oxidoreductase-domain-containing protein n=1 Tax=Lasiosphaeria ovina TaxID=92902 RepID=A0AAE0JWA5_9PEZI|nr:GMC oxidoreductase-domain-containing protein [Lasiosphaeria ovina]
MQSPKLSGIGDSKLLESLGISTPIHNPNVGENLQNHIMLPLGFEVKPKITTSDDFANPAVFQAAMDEYVATRSGPLTVVNASSALLSLPQVGGSYSALPENPENQAFEAERPEFAAQRTQLLHAAKAGSTPFSRGTVHAASVDARVNPRFDLDYLSHPADLDLPGYTCLTEDNVDNFIRDTLLAAYHFTGACAILPREKDRVVDKRFRVYGVEGPRVVDASVSPLIPQANPNSLVIAVAERAADFIKDDYGHEMGNVQMHDDL